MTESYYDLTKNPITKQRRQKLVRDDDWIRQFLQRALVGQLATRWEGQPFVTPTSFWYDRDTHRIYFHSNIVGRMRANIEHFPDACFAASELGRMLPANTAVEFSLQFRSVMAFGKVRILTEEAEQKYALYGLITRYFPQMRAGEHYRPITDTDLARTSTYAFEIESWSGKENWDDQAEQSADWAPLPAEWLPGFLEANYGQPPEDRDAIIRLVMERVRAEGTPEVQQAQITILDIAGDIATVKAASAGFVQYLHLNRANGTWHILNTLSTS